MLGVFLYGKNSSGYKTTLEDIYVSESLQTINRAVDVNERWFSIYLDSDHVSDGSRIPVEGCRSSAGDDVAVKRVECVR